MSDPDQRAEATDEDRLDDEFPPDRPLGADDRGITGQEQLGGESVAERDERTETDVWRHRVVPREPGQAPVVESGGPPTNEVEDRPIAVDEETKTGPIAPDDQFTGDETTRDVPPERTSPAAEEMAVHAREEEPPAE